MAALRSSTTVSGLLALIATATISTAPGCKRTRSPAADEDSSKASIHFLEIVTDDVDPVIEFYQRLHGLCFGPPDPDLGQARVATRADGTLVGVRKPLAAHEKPIMRTYIAVDDIHAAVDQAKQAGAVVAYPPTVEGKWGTFAILFQGQVQHGLWQR